MDTAIEKLLNCGLSEEQSAAVLDVLLRFEGSAIMIQRAMEGLAGDAACAPIGRDLLMLTFAARNLTQALTSAVVALERSPSQPKQQPAATLN